MWPHLAHRRRWNHQPPEARHSRQPGPLGGTPGSIGLSSDKRQHLRTSRMDKHACVLTAAIFRPRRKSRNEALSDLEAPKLGGVAHDVDLADPAADDGQADDRDDLAGRSDDQPRAAIDDRRTAERCEQRRPAP